MTGKEKMRKGTAAHAYLYVEDEKKENKVEVWWKRWSKRRQPGGKQRTQFV